MTNTNGKSHGYGIRLDRLEELAFGFVDENGKAHDGFIMRLTRIESLAKVLVILALVPAAHFLGVPTENVGQIAQGLATLLRFAP